MVPVPQSTEPRLLSKRQHRRNGMDPSESETRHPGLRGADGHGGVGHRDATVIARLRRPNRYGRVGHSNTASRQRSNGSRHRGHTECGRTLRVVGSSGASGTRRTTCTTESPALTTTTATESKPEGLLQREGNTSSEHPEISRRRQRPRRSF